MNRLILASLISLATVSSAYAQVTVKDPWVRATVPAQKTTGAFMQLSAAADSRLVAVRSSVADMVEIHAMTMSGNVMRMRAVSGVDLPAGKPVDIEPDGFHIMLMGLKKQVKEGDTVPITLVFAGKDGKRQSVEVKAIARPLSAAMGSGGDAGNMGH